MSAISAHNRICLAGDWSMCGVSTQLPQLAAQLDDLTGTAPEDTSPATTTTRSEIDLQGIDCFDACGCQLLAVFLHALHQKGLRPLLSNIPGVVSDMIGLLGFAGELARHADYPRQCP